MNLFYQPGLAQQINWLDEEESRHALKVLRLKEGDAFKATDGLGTFYHCEITGVEKNKCLFRVLSQEKLSRPRHTIHLAVAPTKNMDRMEWLTEKATEFGVDRITPLLCCHSERKQIKEERLLKIAISAMKQSFRPWLPEIAPLTYFSEILSSSTSQKFIAHASGDQPTHLKNAAVASENYLVLIGPEGDFAPEEIKQALSHGFVMVSLGDHRLRTETAALAACHILNLLNE